MQAASGRSQSSAAAGRENTPESRNPFNKRQSECLQRTLQTTLSATFHAFGSAIEERIVNIEVDVKQVHADGMETHMACENAAISAAAAAAAAGEATKQIAALQENMEPMRK